MDPNTTVPVKVKKTRRRLRLSCVECTKRRQKCDRTYPCGLCVSRGVPHLCHWSPVPIARPTPAKPPARTKTVVESEDHKKIQHLSDRICLLERQLEQSETSAIYGGPSYPINSSQLSNSRNDSSEQSSCSSVHSGSVFSTPEPASWNSDSVPCLDANTLESIAHSLQVLPAGQELHIGRGSSLHTLRQMLNNHIPPNIHNTGQNGHSYSPLFVMRPNFSQDTLSKLASLVDKIPPHSVTEQLLNSCFDYCNWKFGLPKKWIIEAVAQTKDFLHYPASPLDACIHPGWLCLIFALLASAPPSTSNDLGHNSELFFQCSLAALHNAEAMPRFSGFVSAKAPLEGSVLACLAVPLLSKRFAALGRSDGVHSRWVLLDPIKKTRKGATTLPAELRSEGSS